MEKVKKKKFFLLIIYLIPMAVLTYHCMVNNFSADSFLAYKEQFNTLRDANLILFALLFLLIYSAFVTSSISFNVIMNLFAGYLFGSIMGALLANIAITCGSYLLFLISRSSTAGLRDKHSNLKILKADKKDTILTLFFLRLSPFFPAPLITIGCGTFNVKNHIFILTTFFGSFPLILIYALIGSHLETINQISDIYDGNLMILLFSLTLISLSPLLKHEIRAMLGIKKIQSLFVFSNKI